MMKRTGMILGIAGLFCAALVSFGAERVAVADPQVKSGIKPEEVAGISDYIESRINGPYEVFSRSALKAILKEWEFSESGMVLDDQRKGALEQKNVHLLIVPTLAKVGDQVSFTLLAVDPITGKVDSRHSIGLQVSSFSDFFRRMDGALVDAGLRNKDAKPVRRKLALLPATAAAGVTLPAGTAEELTNRLGELLLKSGSFELLSREDLDRMSQEAKLASKDFAEPGSLSKLGNLKIADDLAVIHVSRFQTRLKSNTTSIAGKAADRVLIDISIQLRLVDASIGNIVALENVDANLDSRNILASVRRDWSMEDYRSEAIRILSVKAADQVVNALDPLLVAAVDGKTLYLSRGEGTSIKVGSTCKLFMPGKPLVHPTTGQTIGTQEKEVGEAKITEVLPGFSTAAITHTSGEITTGVVCRFPNAGKATRNQGKEPAPVYPKAR